MVDEINTGFKNPEINFADLIEPVARALWGEPNPKYTKPGVELRWGTRGSRVVYLSSGRWVNNETGNTGGVLDMVNSDHREAMRWLATNKFIPSQSTQAQDKPSGGAKSKPGKIVARYSYKDETGKLLYQVVRFKPKDFRQRQPTAGRGWTWNMSGVRRVPYRLPKLIEAVKAGKRIYIPEGEKDVQRLHKVNVASTTNPGGAGKWRDEYSEFLRGADCVLLQDNDDPGREHVAGVAAKLHGIAKSIRIVDLAEHWPKGADAPKEGDDVSDWLKIGGTVEQLEAITKSTPVWQPGTNNEQQNGKKKYEMVRASDVIIKPLQWLWRGHLLRGAQELVAGIPGLGKSQIQCSLVACATTGCDWPDGAPGTECGNVIMVTAEDALDQVVVPRLIAAGADLERVAFLKAIKQDEKRRMFLLGEDLDVLEQMIRDVGNVNLVAIDPLTAFMGKINSGNVTDVRGQLGPLTDLAERTQVAFATVTHPPKQGGQRAIDQYIGSQAFIAAARIGHLCQPEMKVNDSGATIPTGRNLFTWATGNHMKMATLAYEIEEINVQQPTPPGDRAAAIRARAAQVETVRIVWQGESQITADEAVANASSKPQSRTAEVDKFLRELLSKGPVPAKVVFKKAEDKGFSKEQVRGAKKRIGADRRKVGLTNWEWFLPKGGRV